MKRFLVAAAVGALVLAGCTESPVRATEAYQIGCPLVDATLAGGSVTNRAALAGLKALRASEQLAPETAQWLDATITLLESADPEDLPAEVRERVVDGCAENGFPLRNLG